LSAELCRALDEVATRGTKVSWHALAHRVRGRVITSAGSEHQWVVASGPCERVLFSRDSIADTAAVGFVVTREQAWLRVGGLQGSLVDDQWTLHDLDERVLAHARVCGVELNRSVLELDRPLAPDEPREGHARLVRAASPTRVALAAPLAARHAAQLADSPWLCLDTRQPQAELACDGERVELRDHDPRWPPLVLDDFEAAIELLEDRARARRLLALSPRGHELLRITGLPARLCANDPLVLQLACAPDVPDPLYVALVLIDRLGHARQLEPEHAEGIPIARDQPYSLSIDGLARLPATLLVIAADRPLPLGALIRPDREQAAGLPLGLALAGRRMRSTVREPRPPLDAKRWALVRIELEQP
jgi:hypothetical protein